MSRIHETLHERDVVLFIQFLRDVLEDLRRLFKLLRDPRSSLFNNYIVTKAAVTKLKSFLNGYSETLIYITFVSENTYHPPASGVTKVMSAHQSFCPGGWSSMTITHVAL